MVSPLHKALLRDLWHLRGQVIAAGLVVACGLAAFITMRSVYHSLVEARASYYAQYRFADIFAHLKRAPDSLAERLARTSGVAAIQTRIVEDVTLSVPQLQEPATGRLISLPESSAPGLNEISIRLGRAPRPDRSDEIVASETFARANGLTAGDRIGAILNGRWRELTIVGVALSPEYIYEVGPGMIFPDNRRFGVLWMNHDELAAAFDMTDAFNDLALRTARGVSQGDIIRSVDRLLEPYGGLAAYGRADQASNRFLTDELGEIEVNATVIPAIFLGVSAFLVYTLLSRLVTMQRGEIGLLKSFGYTSSRIGAHFLEFAVLVVTLGLLLGTIAAAYLGAYLIDVYRAYFHFPTLRFYLPASVLLSAVGIALAAAVLGSVSAVSRAVRLPAAEAMRPEPPKSYRAGVLESAGLLHQVGASGRVILRNIARRPGRAALSVIGIAAAVGTVVVGRFTFDAVSDLMAAHFDSAEREDASVILRETASAASGRELARMPGVLHAEPFRAVPVKLRIGYREKRTIILGLPPRADLKRLIDASRRPIQLPPDGLVLTRKLAEMLSVREGDVVTIEELEGRRLVFSEPVVRLSDEPLGVSAYMDAGALARRMDEDQTLSGAALQVDRSREESLYRELKRTPAVGAVAVRAAMLETVREIMNRSFILMTIIMSGFAVVLVIGVVYNSARIALSERGNELASLRVLGFSKREVTGLLLGEQVLLTLAAIPLGFAIGAAICRMLVPVFDREMFRLPFVLTPVTLDFAALVTVVSAAFSGLLVARRIATLDLIAVLKSRE